MLGRQERGLLPGSRVGGWLEAKAAVQGKGAWGLGPRGLRWCCGGFSGQRTPFLMGCSLLCLWLKLHQYA